MIFSRNCRLKSKQAVLLLSCLGFLSMIFLPGASFALPVVVSSTGQVSINNLTGIFSAFPETAWNVDGEDTRYSFSSAAVELTWKQPAEEILPYTPGFTTTSAAAYLSNVLGQTTGQASTSPTQLLASANTSVNLFSKLIAAEAEVTIAQAAFTGQFQVNSPTAWILSLPVDVKQTLKSITPFGIASSDILAEISVSHFILGLNGDEVEVVDSSDKVSLTKYIRGVKSYSLVKSAYDYLDLNVSLDPQFTYYFELSASVKGWADPPAETSVPEPASMLLLGAGLLGIGFFSRKLKKDR